MLRIETDPSTWTIGALENYIGGQYGQYGLSQPSKMPSYGYSLPASTCKVGSRLAEQPGTVCSGCYALKGRYAWKPNLAAMQRRLDSLDKPLWVEVISELINRRAAQGHQYFRWHDSGDLQSVDHLRMIIAVCELTPGVRHWLPTREYRVVRDFVADGGNIPANLNIRLSAHKIGGFAPSFPALQGLVTVSTVSPKGDNEHAHACPAQHQDNSCGSCRACWDRGVDHVDYHLH